MMLDYYLRLCNHRRFVDSPEPRETGGEAWVRCVGLGSHSRPVTGKG